MAEEWYVGINGRQSGPFLLEQLRQMAASGQLSKADLIWRDGFSNWVPCSSIKELFPAAADFTTAASRRPAPRRTAPPPRSPSPSEEGVTAADIAGGVDLGLPGQSPNAGMNNGPAGTAAGAPPLPLADFLPRIGATLLDGLFVGLISCIPNVIVFGILIAANANKPENTEATGLLANICINIIGFIVGGIFYVTLDASAKQGTWGKQIVGLKVTDIGGRRISVGRAIGRFIARYLSICTCGIGYLLPLFTKNRQTLHDMICGCIVLNK
jgi:uncharacterized RDD family membrane protein YckC